MTPPPDPLLGAAQKALDFLRMLGAEWQRKYGEPVSIRTQGEVERGLEAALRAAPAEPQPAVDRDRLAAARFVATYWRDAMMALPPDSELRAASHPLAMVLAALDGETDPQQLGISGERHGDFLAALPTATEPADGTGEDIAEQLRRLIDDIAPTEARRQQAQRLRRELVKAALQRGADKMLAGMAEAERVRAALRDDHAEVEAIRERNSGLGYEETRRPLDTAPPEIRALWRARQDVSGLLAILDHRMSKSLADAALWLEAEADHPRPDPRPAMRLQASLIRGVLTAPTIAPEETT